MENKDSEVQEKIDNLEDKIEDFKNKCEEENLKSVAKLFKKVRSETSAEKKSETFGRALGRIWGIYKNRPDGFLTRLKNFFTKSRYYGIGPLARAIENFVHKSGTTKELKEFDNIIKILQKTVNRIGSKLYFSEVPEAITSLTGAELRTEKWKKMQTQVSPGRMAIIVGWALSCYAGGIGFAFADKLFTSEYMQGDENEADRRISKLAAGLILNYIKDGIKEEYKKIKNVIRKQSKIFDKYESNYEKLNKIKDKNGTN